MLNMFMNPISHVNDLQLLDHRKSDLPLRPNRRIRFNDLSNLEQGSPSEDLKNKALSSLTATRLQKWGLAADNLPSAVTRSPSEPQPKWSHLQYGAPSSYRIPLSHVVRSHPQANFGGSEAYLEKRSRFFRRRDYYESFFACNISYLAEAFLPGPTTICNQESSILPEQLESNFNHSFKRRRMHLDSHLSSSHNQKSSRISNSTSSTSLPLIEDLNFDALKDPTDGTLAHPSHESSPVSSSLRCLTSGDDFFVVQTPSKSINESDQQSFHLSSPPSGFGNLGGTTNVKSTNSFRPRVLFRNNNFESDKPLSTSLIKGLNVPLNIRPPKQRSSFVGPLNQPKSSTSDSIALSMAKMTVWNRVAAASTPIAPVKTQQPVMNAFRSGLSVSHPISSISGVKLPYPIQKEPEFAIRRILQMAYGKNWRQFALGENQDCEDAVQMAHRFLNAESKDPY